MIEPEKAGAWWAFAARALLGADRDALCHAAAALPPVPGLPDPADIRASLECEALDLEREYVRLFLRPEGAPCPPWQSVWSPEPQLMGDSHHRALEWYRRAEVEPQAASEPADHAGLLAAFWAGWILPEAGPAERRDFFREHLAWMQQFSAAIAEHARHPFYRALAELLRALLADAAGHAVQPERAPGSQLA